MESLGHIQGRIQSQITDFYQKEDKLAAPSTQEGSDRDGVVCTELAVTQKGSLKPRMLDVSST
jgi:hypothetical protein